MSYGGILVRNAPFRHGVFASVLSSRTEHEVLNYLEQVDWVKRSASFYRFEVPVDDSKRSAMLSLIEDELQLDEGRWELEKTFECRLGTDLRLELHKYGLGDGIGPHTDLGTPEVRFVLNLNRGWRMEEGGVWALASDSTLQRQTEYLPSLSNTGFVFSTNKKSFHALSRYDGSAIYGLIVRIPRI